MENEVLKPCPFCGNRPIYVVNRLEGLYIKCPYCEVRTAGYFDNNPVDPPNAISTVREIWNKREELSLNGGKGINA